jgi:hypothetical protein
LNPFGIEPTALEPRRATLAIVRGLVVLSLHKISPKILIDGYDADFISVASDRVDLRSPEQEGLFGAGLDKEVICVRFPHSTVSA